MRKTVTLLLTLVIFIALCSGIIVVGLSVRCLWMNTIPIAPIYPGSLLESRDIFGVGDALYPIVDYHYSVSSPPERVLEFYNTMDECSYLDDTIKCPVKTTPFGDGSVQIDMNSYTTNGTTQYLIEIQWKGCTYNWSE